MSQHTTGLGHSRTQFDDSNSRMYWYQKGFGIYKDVGKGLFDLGPPGVATKNNIVNLWKHHFIIHDNMLEIESTTLTPHSVLKASGHVDQFSDILVCDAQTQQAYRADSLLEDFLEEKIANSKDPAEIDALTKELVMVEGLKPHQIDAALKRHNVLPPQDQSSIAKKSAKKSKKSKKSKKNKNKQSLSDSATTSTAQANKIWEPCTDFNLMFQCQFGPSKGSIAYLRPETAQGIFVNFKKLLQFNSNKLPMAVAQSGISYRNEIGPRQKLIRTREFLQAEIEHFYDPDDNTCQHLDSVKHVVLNLLSAQIQEQGHLTTTPMTIGEALKSGVIKNPTLAYYLGRSQLFLEACGLIKSKIRFRQHMQKQMAHYANDCWDAEALCQYGWIELAGHADRGAFDLESHEKASKQDMHCIMDLPEPVTKTVIETICNKKILGKTFKRDSQSIVTALTDMTDSEKLKLKALFGENPQAKHTLSINNKEFIITSSMVTIEQKTVVEHVKKFIPRVIEPSFGISRILFLALDHAFDVRSSSSSTGTLDRIVTHLPASIAPYQCSILTVKRNPTLIKIASEISRRFSLAGINHRVDTSGASIGRSYARTDEMGIPFGCSLDAITQEEAVSNVPFTFTIRDRDSMNQIRVNLDQACLIISKLCSGFYTWQEAYDTYPRFSSESEETKQLKSSQETST